MNQLAEYFKGSKSHLAIDELDVTRALRVAVAGTVLSTSLVASVGSHATISLHLGEVERAVKTARKVGDVNIESELLVEGLEHLVVRVVLHKVDTRTDVFLCALGDEFESEGVAAGGDTVGTRVVSTVKGTVSSTSLAIGAKASVPFIAGIAVSVTAGGMEPTPVGIESNLSGGYSRAAARLGALLPGKRRVGFSGGSTSLLTKSNSGERKGEESDPGEHFEESKLLDVCVSRTDTDPGFRRPGFIPSRQTYTENYRLLWVVVGVRITLAYMVGIGEITEDRRLLGSRRLSCTREKKLLPADWDNAVTTGRRMTQGGGIFAK